MGQGQNSCKVACCLGSEVFWTWPLVLPVLKLYPVTKQSRTLCIQAMNFGAVLPDVKANLPLPGQTLGNGSNIVQRACVPGIEANCTTVPFTSIMVGQFHVSHPIYSNRTT